MAETKPTGAKKHITGARIAQEIKQYKKDALISPLYTVCCVILEILIPYLTASIIDKGIAVGNMAHVAKIGALMADASAGRLAALQSHRAALLCRRAQLDALLARATEPEYGPAIPVATASGLRVLPFADIEYLECTHHVVHFHLASGEDVPSLSVRVPFAQVAQPLLADERFVQLHRSYVVNLAAVSQLAAGEFWMQSGARVPVPRGREPAARTALKDYLEKQFR